MLRDSFFYYEPLNQNHVLKNTPPHMALREIPELEIKVGLTASLRFSMYQCTGSHIILMKITFLVDILTDRIIPDNNMHVMEQETVINSMFPCAFYDGT